MPKAVTDDTLTLNYNDAGGLEEVFKAQGEQIAAVIVEPVAGNMNCVPPTQSFLEALRKYCDEHGAVLIFDEVMTGFRVSLGGAQAFYGVTPDLTTLGKIIGGGMPVGALGGKRRSWSICRRWARSTRRAPCPGTRWPWPPAWPR